MIRAYFDGNVLCFEDIESLLFYMEEQEISNIDCAVGDFDFTIVS